MVTLLPTVSPSWIQFWNKFYNNKAMWGLGFWVKSKVYKMLRKTMFYFSNIIVALFATSKTTVVGIYWNMARMWKRIAFLPGPMRLQALNTQASWKCQIWNIHTYFLSSPITLRNCWWGQSFFLKRKSAVVMHDCTSPSSSILHTMAKSYTYYVLRKEKARNGLK